MKKIKNKYLFHILAFLIPIVLILIFFVILKIRFNNISDLSNEILMADMSSQYLPLMQYFSNVLHGTESLIYSFSNGLGGNMISTYAYYLASPLNLLLILATSSNITNIIFILILIKFGLCGLTMYIFLNHKIDNNRYNALIISVFYSLMAYNVSYYFNTMWIDLVYLLPLVLYGIDDIITSKKITKYVLFLSLSIFSNFYISYMVAIFAVIYFISEMVHNFGSKDKEEIYKCIKIFIISSLISGMICSVILVPTILDMRNMIRSSISDSMYIRDNIYEGFLMALSKLFALPNGKANVLSKYTPNVYFGLLPLIYSVSYFFSKEKFKNKLSALIIICFFLLSFSTNSLNLLWHGFSFPNGYAYRFSFLFSFFMLYLAYRGMCNKCELKTNNFIYFVCILIFIGFIQIIDGSNICFSFINIIVTIIFLILYYVLIKIRLKKYINKLICILIIIELELLLNNSFITTSYFDYGLDYNAYYVNACENSKKYKDKNYKIDNISLLDSFYCSDYRLLNALTTNNGDLYKFFYNSGFVTTYSMVANTNNTPVIYSLLGIKYYYDYNDTNNIVEKIKYYDGNNSSGEKEYSTVYVHNNPYALPYGYVINSNYDDIFKESKKDNPFEYQNALLKSMSGIKEDSLKPYKLEKIDKKHYKLYINNDKDIYFYLKHGIPENEIVFGNITLDKKNKYEINLNMSGVFNIGNEYYGIVDVDLSSKYDYYYENDDVLNFYYFDEEIFKKQIEVLKENPFIVTDKYKNRLIGNIELGEDGILFLSIPYENGFDIEIDGKKIDYLKLYDSFIGLKVNKGSHEVKIKFKLPGLKVGAFVSLLGILLLVLFNNKNKLKKS